MTSPSWKFCPRKSPKTCPAASGGVSQKSKGYNWILVNGQITFEDGKPTGALPGKFLRNGRG
jgi:N-acyl-D-aspartate/D-glutamate deacylase